MKKPTVLRAVSAPPRPRPSHGDEATPSAPPVETGAAGEIALADAPPADAPVVVNPGLDALKASLPQLIAVGVLFLATYFTTFKFMMGRWTHDENYQHGWLVIPIAAVVVWYKRDKLRALPVVSHRGGLWVMALALFFHLVEKAIDLNGPSPLSIPIFVAGAVWYFTGTAWLRELSFPLAYLLFMLPIPGGFTEVVSFPLRLMATTGSRHIAEWFGVHTIGAGMNLEFMQPRGDEYVRLEVADPCSGLHSLMAIKALHAITAYLSRLKIGWKWVLFWCAMPIALASNLIRIVGIILVAAYVDKDLGINLFHKWSPYILFIIVFSILIGVGRFLEWATGGTDADKAERAAKKAAAQAASQTVEGATA